MIFRKIILMVLIAFPALAFAQVEKDWSFSKRLDPGLNVMTCVAMTAVAESKIPVQAEIILPETDEKGPLLLVKAKGLGGQVPRAYVRPDANTAYMMLLLNSDAVSGVDTFVLSPLRFPESLKVIAEKVKLDIYFGEGPTAILARVSLRGSAVTINRAAACRTSKQLLNQSLFNELKVDAHLAEVQAGTLEDFFNAYQATVNQLNLRAQIKTELSASQAQTTALKKQVATSEVALAAAVKNEQATILEIDNIKKRISALQASLQKAQQDLPGLQAQKTAATDQVNKAQAALDPFMPEINRLQNEINIAQSQLSSAQATVSRLQSEISSLQGQISNLEIKTDQLRSESETKRRQIDNLKSDRQRWENEYRFFDLRRRTDEILRQSSSYQREKRDLDQNIQRRQQLPNEVEFARSRMIEAQNALSRCQSQPPPVNCSVEASNHQRLSRDFEAKRAELQNIDREIERNRAQIRNFEMEAERVAQREKDQLLQNINRLDQEIRRVESEVAEMDRRIRDIQTIEIPRLSRQIDSARSQLSTAQMQASNAAADVRRAEANLDRYKQSVGYDSLAAKLRDAKAVLRDINAKILDAEKIIGQAPSQISAAQQSLQAQQQELSRREQLRLQAEANLSQANAALQQQESHESGIIVRLEAAETALLAAKRKTQGISKNLFGY